MKRILIAESDNRIRRELTYMLELADYFVYTARNGREAMEIIQQHMPDLVISATVMPLVDGLGLLDMIRHNEKTEAIPVIMISAGVDRKEFRNAMESGADDFMMRPFNDDELLKAVRNRFRTLNALIKKINRTMQTEYDPYPSVIEKSDVLSVNEDMRMVQNKNTIHQQVPTGHILYLMCNENVRTHTTYEDGKQIIIGLHNKDCFLGHIALLAESTYKKMSLALPGGATDYSLHQ